MEYTTDNEITVERLDSIKFESGDFLYVSGESLLKHPELLNYEYRKKGFKLIGRRMVATHKHWWQFWIPREHSAIVFVYKPEEKSN